MYRPGGKGGNGRDSSLVFARAGLSARQPGPFLPYDPNERRMVGRVYSSKSASGSVSKEHQALTGPSEEEMRTSS